MASVGGGVMIMDGSRGRMVLVVTAIQSPPLG